MKSLFHLAAAGTVALGLTAAPQNAEAHGRRYGHHQHYHGGDALGGLALGLLFGGALGLTTPRYAPPPPAYYVQPPTYYVPPPTYYVPQQQPQCFWVPQHYTTGEFRRWRLACP